MKQTKMRFLSSVFVLCLFGMADAVAAPSVKMLGTNTARIGMNTTAVKSTANTSASSQPQQRISSVRAKNLTSGTPVTVNTTIAVPSEDSRISLSNASLNKYLHSPSANGVAQTKPTTPTTPTNPSVSDQDFTALTDRVQDLETGIEGKQDALSVGTGLTFEDNEVSLNDEYAQLPERIDELEDELDSKVTMADVNNVLTNNYYNTYQIQTLLNNQATVDVRTIYDYMTGERKYVTVADTFDESILN